MTDKPLGYFASESPAWVARYKRDREFIERFDAWKAASARVMDADMYYDGNMQRAAKAANAMLADLRVIYGATIEEMVVARASATAPYHKENT